MKSLWFLFRIGYAFIGMALAALPIILLVILANVLFPTWTHDEIANRIAIPAALSYWALWPLLTRLSPWLDQLNARVKKRLHGGGVVHANSTGHERAV